MISFESLDAITERVQTANMKDPAACARILAILARHRESLSRLQSQIAECEEIEKAILELVSYLDTLDGEGGR